MKFKISSKTLYNATSAVSKVINAKNTLAILNNFLVELEDNMLTITGSDIENAISATIEVDEAEGEGKLCMDARRLVDLLKVFPDLPLDLKVDDETLEVTISQPGREYTMVATPGDQYPIYKKEEDTAAPVAFACSAESILKGIDNTMFAVGTDDFHPQMMGIYFDIKPESITFVATDTRKLVKYVDKKVAPEVTASCIMPIKPASIIKNVFAPEDTLAITLTSKSATIQNGTYTFNCRFIKGNFPPYDKVIPKNNPYVLTVDRVRFLNAVRRVGVFVDPGFGMEKFKFTNDKVFLKSSDANLLTKGDEVLDCQYEGPELVIGFNAPFLIDICNIITTENLVINLSDPSRPGVFHPSEDEENTELLMLLMPMNVTEF